MRKSLIENSYLLIIFCSIPAIFFALNYSGFCVIELRYLGSQEKMKHMFNISKISRNPSYRRIFVNGEYKSLKRKNTYASFTEFLAKHPNCCEIDPGGPYDIGAPIFINRITGYDSGSVIRFRFEEEFLDSEGNVFAEEVEILDRLQNCGESRW